MVVEVIYFDLWRDVNRAGLVLARAQADLAIGRGFSTRPTDAGLRSNVRTATVVEIVRRAAVVLKKILVERPVFLREDSA
jgi:hypothetical protein